MVSRRDFFNSMVGAAAVTVPTFRKGGIEQVLSATSAVARRSPEEVAQDEDYWMHIQQAFTNTPDARGVDVATLREADSVVVEGVLVRLDGGTLPSDTTWPIYVRRADPAVLQRLFEEPLQSLVLRRTVMPPDLPRIVPV